MLCNWAAGDHHLDVANLHDDSLVYVEYLGMDQADLSQMNDLIMHLLESDGASFSFVEKLLFLLFSQIFGGWTKLRKHELLNEINGEILNSLERMRALNKSTRFVSLLHEIL